MTFKWKRELLEYFIICMQEKSCIYVKSTENMDRMKKAQAFNSVLEEMKKIDSEITLEEIKRKWRILRTQYMQELRAMNLSKKSGSGAADTYTPKLWCFQQLDFLRTHSEAKKSTDNIKEIIKEEEDELKTSSDEAPANKRKKRSDTVEDFSNQLESFKNILMQRKAEKKFAWLGALVTNQMEQISPENQPAAAWEVQCLMQKLTNQSRKRTCSTSSSKDIIELSMEGIFPDDTRNKALNYCNFFCSCSRQKTDSFNMEKIQETAAKVKKLSASFEKEVDDILKKLSDPDKTKLQTDLKVSVFFENVLQVNQHLCELNCKVLQMRHDLHNLKEEDNEWDNKNINEKEKLIMLLYTAEELYGDLKSDTIKKLEGIMEKNKKMKFSIDEIQAWIEIQNFIKATMERINI